MIYFTARNDIGRNVIRCPSYYCDKLITSRRVRNSKGKFSSRYESAAGCEHRHVYSRSLRLDNTPLACYNGGPTCITTAPRNVPLLQDSFNSTVYGFVKLFLAANKAEKIWKKLEKYFLLIIK